MKSDPNSSVFGSIIQKLWMNSLNRFSAEVELFPSPVLGLRDEKREHHPAYSTLAISPTIHTLSFLACGCVYRTGMAHSPYGLMSNMYL